MSQLKDNKKRCFFIIAFLCLVSLSSSTFSQLCPNSQPLIGTTIQFSSSGLVLNQNTHQITWTALPGSKNSINFSGWEVKQNYVYSISLSSLAQIEYSLSLPNPQIIEYKMHNDGLYKYQIWFKNIASVNINLTAVNNGGAISYESIDSQVLMLDGTCQDTCQQVLNKKFDQNNIQLPEALCQLSLYHPFPACDKTSVEDKSDLLNYNIIVGVNQFLPETKAWYAFSGYSLSIQFSFSPQISSQTAVYLLQIYTSQIVHPGLNLFNLNQNNFYRELYININQKYLYPQTVSLLFVPKDIQSFTFGTANAIISSIIQFEWKLFKYNIYNLDLTCVQQCNSNNLGFYNDQAVCGKYQTQISPLQECGNILTKGSNEDYIIKLNADQKVQIKLSQNKITWKSQSATPIHFQIQFTNQILLNIDLFYKIHLRFPVSVMFQIDEEYYIQRNQPLPKILIKQSTGVQPINPIYNLYGQSQKSYPYYSVFVYSKPSQIQTLLKFKILSNSDLEKFIIFYVESYYAYIYHSDQSCTSFCSEQISQIKFKNQFKGFFCGNISFYPQFCTNFIPLCQPNYCSFNQNDQQFQCNQCSKNTILSIDKKQCEPDCSSLNCKYCSIQIQTNPKIVCHSCISRYGLMSNSLCSACPTTNCQSCSVKRIPKIIKNTVSYINYFVCTKCIDGSQPIRIVNSPYYICSIK